MAKHSVIETDIVVAGTGPAGLIAALSLARDGFEVVLAGPTVGAGDPRTTALMVPALEALETLGLGSIVAVVSEPLEAMRIIDATKRLVRSPTVTFRANEIGEPHFGLNIANRDLNAALEAKIGTEPHIEWRKSLVWSWRTQENLVEATLEDGTIVSAKLAVAADGRLSPAREAAGIRVDRRDLPQAALVLTFAHSRPHGRISTEFHTEDGPFTQVPLKGMRSSLVWVTRPGRAKELLALDDAALSRAVEDGMQSMLGRVEIEGGRQIFPLTASTPQRFAQNRFALVGEAAHIFPPIGAQGLNLGIRDTQDLAAVAGEHRNDPGAPAAMQAYDAKRRPAVGARRRHGRAASFRAVAGAVHARGTAPRQRPLFDRQPVTGTDPAVTCRS
jgi:2-octaprenyl-6-methoxyphenol hydroxylase